MFRVIVFWIISAYCLLAGILNIKSNSVGYIFVISAVFLVLGFLRFQKIQEEKYKRECERQEEEERERQRKEEHDRRMEAYRQQRKEYLSTHDEIVTRIAGVTFDNDDRSSRQKILKAIYDDPDSDLGRASLQKYEYNGEPAYHVLFEGRCVGNIPADTVEEVEAIESRIEDLTLEVSTFENEDDKTIYRAELTIGYLKQ